jgi:Family of unknown function (DUF5706)
MTQQPQDLGGNLTPPPASVPSASLQPEIEHTDDKKGKKKKKKKENRGVDTMFRVTYQNHIALSRLADNKAHMLMYLNGLIVSAVVAFLRTRLGTLSWDIAPVFVLIVGCMVSLAFAVLGARPRVSRQGVTIDGVRNNAENLLFFGQFTTLSLPEFQEALHVLMKDPALLYDNLGRQLYLMGQSLNRKYRYLQIAYLAFLAATGLATALYVIGYFVLGFGG